VSVVKLHRKTACKDQGLEGIEALTEGAKVLACVGVTEDGETEELTE
jgi:hypothetical protein